MMNLTNKHSQTQSPVTERAGEPFASHEFRLSMRQWAVVSALVILVLTMVSPLWQRIEPLAVSKDHRMPYELSEDYWLYSRLGLAAAKRSRTLVVGDSVIWGQYVTPAETLTGHLNVLAGDSRFVNLGLNGAYPAALSGLIEHYCKTLCNQSILLHCNPLWLASDRHDLRATTKRASINHPGLLPQFVPWLACYDAMIDERLQVVAERTLPYNSWAKHLRVAYFHNADIPAWTVEHPDRNPVTAITLKLPAPQARPRRKGVSWMASGLQRTAFPWVELDSSVQWDCFKRLLKVLTARGNRVFVCIGPLNEHMLTDQSRQVYLAVRSGMQNYLKDNDIPYVVPEVLPSEFYADASHPLSKGYELLARSLYEDSSFAHFAGMLPKENLDADRE